MAEWTPDTLYIHFAKLIEAVDDQTKERVLAQNLATEAAMAAANKAIEKADKALEKRLDSVNEFRATLKDQQGLFVTRTEVYAIIGTACTVVLIVAHYLPR